MIPERILQGFVERPNWALRFIQHKIEEGGSTGMRELSLPDFRFNIIEEVGDPQFAGMHKDSYNFLLVCHHWFEVARRLLELWSFWGNSLEDVLEDFWR